MPAVPVTAAGPACPAWRAALPPHSGPLQLLLSAGGNVARSNYEIDFVLSTTLQRVAELKPWGKNKEMDQNITLMRSRTWSTVKLGADWDLRLNLCMEQQTDGGKTQT